MVKKISLFVSMALALLMSFQLLPEVMMYLSRANALEADEIWTIIVFLFSAPLLVIALVVAIKSFKNRAYEKFAVWLNFSGALTICIHKVGGIFPWFKMFDDYGGEYGLSFFILITELLVSLTAVVATMLFATYPVFVKRSENDLYY